MTTEERLEAQPFNQWLERHARGTLNDEATVALGEVVQSVSDLKSKGKLIIEILVEPAGPDGRTVALGGKVTTRLPQPAPELGVFYVGDSGSLHRDDPYQQRIPGVPVPIAAGDAGETRTVDTETGEIRTVEEPAPPQRVEEETG